MNEKNGFLAEKFKMYVSFRKRGIDFIKICFKGSYLDKKL
ncbi:hypothetical protein KSS87_001697 [Heliosperma pusillum]|nr:hypothetical protein KSS87_001697 [Heliosperma pusillum]